ncbi:hypothetical protein [Pseudomonas aeruginosa]|uniref:hypothetical protein n=1 Tax=Pseudomonas aeruginosa TaxID=287 RepID=UPI0007726DBD|nr:hypothetical protein [Pseudomonas aeruginosa]KXD22394.1 hypothetical protein AW902_19570 [Pseudomonas aeruginosa]KXD25226.1 hypothetical protein AW903_19750 [Pseudomonas aeruginosa]
MNNVQRFWCHEAQNIRCVRESDYAKLEAEAQALREERDRIERNRDMWKGQCERQAEQLAALRARVVVVPERLTNGDSISRMLREIGCDGDVSYHHAREIWNACLDELSRFNGKTVSEGLLRGMGAFAQEIISGALEGGNFDGADLQESAERHGLIAKQVMNEPCRGPEEYCACAWSTSFPTECYRITAELRALLNQDKENGNG